MSHSKVWKPLVQAHKSWHDFYTLLPWMKRTLFIKDCGGGGHCLFAVLAEGLNEWNRRKGKPSQYFRAQDLRNVLADEVGRQPETSLTLLQLHSSLPAPPAKLNTAEYVSWLQHIIRTKASFWGEVQFLQDFYLNSPLFASQQIGFLVLQPVKYKGKKEEHNQRMMMIRCVSPTTRYVMLIFYETHLHFQLLGCMTHHGDIMSIFDRAHQSPKSVVQYLLDTSDLRLQKSKRGTLELHRFLCDDASSRKTQN